MKKINSSSSPNINKEKLQALCKDLGIEVPTLFSGCGGMELKDSSKSCNDRQPITVLDGQEHIESRPTVQEEALQEKLKDLHSRIVCADSVFPEDKPLLAIGDTCIGQRHDLICVKAAPKQGKTRLLFIFTAVFLAGRWGQLWCSETGLKVLYFDTEMKEKDTQHMLRTSLRLAGLPENQQPANLYCVNLRKETPEIIKVLIPDYIELCKPDVVIIDGILDLTYDFNSISESQTIVKDHLLKWADEYDCLVIVTIHTNKQGDTHISQGHLGGTIDKKCEAVLECKLNKDYSLVTVSAPLNRHADIPNFYFKIDEDGTPVIDEKSVQEMKDDEQRRKDEKTQAKRDVEFNKRFSKLKELMLSHGGTMTLTDLRREIETQKIYSKNKVKGFIDECEKRNKLRHIDGGESLTLVGE